MSTPVKQLKKIQVIAKVKSETQFFKKRSASTELPWERRDMVRQTLLGIVNKLQCIGLQEQVTGQRLSFW